MVTFDAKFVGTQTRVVPSLLAKHQREWADAALAEGAAVLVLVGRFGGGGVHVHAVEWRELREGGVELEGVATVEDWAGLVEVCR